MAAGELVWVGHGALGDHDGRLALYLAESLPALLPPPELQPPPALEGRAQLVSGISGQPRRLVFCRDP